MTFNTLTQTLLNFLSIFSAGFGNLYPSTYWLFLTLLGIELVLFGLYWAFGAYQILDAIKKTLFVGIWFWIVSTFPTLANQFVNSLISAGRIAAGGSTFNLLDPSAVAAQGLTASQPILNKINALPVTQVGQMIVLGLLLLIVMAIFLLIAIQIFIAVLEFYLITAIVGIFLPFGLLKHTKFLAEKAIGAVISSGIKLMVLSFILSVAGTVIGAATLPNDPNYNQIFSLILTVGAIGFLAWNAPGIAAGLIAGSPSLTAGTAVQNTVAGGLIGAGAAAAVTQTAKASAAQTARVARLGAATLGAASTGANLALAANPSRNPVSRASSSIVGSLHGMGSAASNTAKNTIKGATSGLSSSATAGARAAAGLASKPSGSGHPQTQAPSWAVRLAAQGAAARHAIPSEAHPSGGNINPKL